MAKLTWLGLLKSIGLLVALFMLNVFMEPYMSSRLGGFLYTSVQNNDTTFVSYVLEKRKWIILGHLGRNVMYTAAEYDSADVIVVALKHGYSTEVKNYYQYEMTPLHVALKYNSLNASALLIDRSADVNVEEENGRTPIYFTQDKVLIKKLISKGAKLNHRDKEGRTPLMYGAFENNPILVTALLERKVDTSVRDKDGKSALDLANAMNNAEIVAILTEYQRQSAEKQEMDVQDKN